MIMFVSARAQEALAREIICFPILYEKKLLGVLEIATFDEICDKNVKFLEEGVRLIAVALNSVLIHKEQKLLLEQTLKNEVLIKKNNEELMQQKEELKSTNDALNEQRLQLIKSEEDLKLQSEELRAANEELEEKQVAIKLQTVNLEKAKKELEDKAQELTLANKYKSEFLANMSHELRTPLNSMLILSKDLADNKKGNLTSQQQQDAEFINEGGKELLNLINDILDLSKVEAGKLDITMEKVLLKQIAKNLQFMFLHQCKKKEDSVESPYR